MTRSLPKFAIASVRLSVSGITMLVFFIHGVATRDIKYADRLKECIKQEFALKNRPLPHFYSSFWGNALSDVSKMWNCLHQDFQDIKTNYPQSHPDDVFRYRQY
ncbi:MAG: hypothetical protein LRZ84_08650 [Desertifilum sp.]|nr:hypothetical protein [Desertifilum sp.]